MAAIGDRVLFNEGVANDAWAVGVIVMTDTDPTADEVAGLNDEWGGYPLQPATGHVFVSYSSLLGSGTPQPASAYATEGTGRGQYQALA
jgi:hypothetical protein